MNVMNDAAAGLPLAADDDRSLAQRVGNGDRAAFEMLMRRHNRRLYRLARSMLRDDAEAEDALQDAYLSAYRSIGQFRGDAALSTWLSRLVLNECLARMRRQARRDNIVRIDNPTSESLKKGGQDNVAKLKKLDGAAFDRAYVDHEVTYHETVLDALDKTLIPSATNDELKALMVKVRPAFVAHLEHAKQLQGSLGKSGG